MVELYWSEDEILSTNLNMYLEYILFKYNNFLKEHIVNEDITLGDLTYLINISLNEGISQKGLSDILFVSEANVAKFIKKLEAKGYVERCCADDNKSMKLLFLTLDGRTLVDQLTLMNSRWEEQVTDFLSDEEISQFKHIIFEICKRSADF